MASAQLAQPTEPLEDSNDTDLYPPTPIHVLAMRQATYQIQGRPADGPKGPAAYEISEYIPEEFAMLSQTHGMPALESFCRNRGVNIQPIPTFSDYSTTLPQTKLKLGQIPLPAPKIVGRASAFPFFDENEHKKDMESEEDTQLGFMGLAEYHVM